MRCLGANEGCGECQHHADDRQGSEPAGAAIAQGGNRQGEPDDEQAHAATNGDDTGDRLPLCLAGNEGDRQALIRPVQSGENSSRDEHQQARDRQVDATGDGARAMSRHRTRGPLTRPGRGGRRRPAGVGLGGASGGRARPGVRALSRGGGGACGARGARATCAACGDAVGGEALGGLSVLLLRHGGTRVLSARGAVPKRGGRSRSSRSTRGAVLRCRAGALVLSGLVRVRDDEGDEADDEGGNYEEAEPASTETDANTAEDADGGQDGGHADKAQEETSQEGNVEASFCGFLRVDAPVLSLGQEEPRQAVGERHEGQAQGCDDGEDSHERQVPSAACSDARADAADDARVGSVPAGGSHGLKETLAGRTLSVGTALVRRTI